MSKKLLAFIRLIPQIWDPTCLHFAPDANRVDCGCQQLLSITDHLHCEFKCGLGEKKKKKTNPCFGKYCVPLPYTQSTCRAALKVDFSYNKSCH